jgi:salicylate hydroxylase
VNWPLTTYSNELQNFAAYELDDKEISAVEEWNINSNQESLLRRMQGFHAAIVTLCQETNEILPLWKCVDRKPLHRLYLDRLVLVGDAAHPMYPHLGQGAAMAIEDAGVLGVLFSHPCDISEIPHRLGLFERARLKRVSVIQVQSRVSARENSMEEVESECHEYFPAGDVPSTYFWIVPGWCNVALLTKQIRLFRKQIPSPSAYLLP